MELILRELNQNDEAAFFEGMKEWVGEKPYWYTFSWKDGMAYKDMLVILEKERLGIDMVPERVPHTMLYAFVDNKIIGRLSVRHKLNEKLSFRGGHIGYAVAPRCRQKGYAKEIVKQGLPYCEKVGIKSLMITCDDNNTPSWKVIEHFGGRLQDKVWDDVGQQTIRRYWIEL